MNANKNVNYKRVVVPIVAILLAAVAVLGVGYALTASVSNTGNAIQTGDLGIDLYDDSACGTRTTTTVFEGQSFGVGWTVDQTGEEKVESVSEEIVVTKYLKIVDTATEVSTYNVACNVTGTIAPNYEVTVLVDGSDVSGSSFTMSKDVAKEVQFKVVLNDVGQSEVTDLSDIDFKFSVTAE